VSLRIEISGLIQANIHAFENVVVTHHFLPSQPFEGDTLQAAVMEGSAFLLAHRPSTLIGGGVGRRQCARQQEQRSHERDVDEFHVFRPLCGVERRQDFSAQSRRGSGKRNSRNQGGIKRTA
jgi:hypothetical protein